jgi:diguanylate cyclase (GGDEF)-like protein/PAS domain S-box-containing protein
MAEAMANGTTAQPGVFRRPPGRLAPSSATLASPRTLVALAMAVCAATWVSITLTLAHGGVAAIWIANGLLVGTMLLTPRTQWPSLVATSALAMLAMRLLNGDGMPLALGISAVNVIEAVIVAGGIRQHVPDIRDPAKLPTLARVAILSTLVACVVSATLSIGVRALVGDATDHWLVWRIWFIAHLLGVVVVATLTVTAMRLRMRLLGREGRRVDFVACLALLAVTCLAIGLQHALPVLFLAYLPLMLLTLRHGFAGVVGGMAVLALAAAVGAGYGLGPFALVAHQSVDERALLLQLFVGAGCLLTYPAAVSQAERQRLAKVLVESESRYRLLAEHSHDLVVRLRPDGTRPYVSASSTALIGWTPEELAISRRELLHPDDRVRVEAEVARLFKHGGRLVTTYRMRHKDGRYVWLEASAQRVDSVAPHEIVYAARDVTARVLAEDALVESQAQLQAVADNMPAMIAHFDAAERFTFANAAVARVLHLDPDAILGRTLREVRGEAVYAEMAQDVAAALAGEFRSFEGRIAIGGHDFDHRTQFVPDIGPDGAVRGFYSLTLDITALKNAERALEQLARFDTLTGLANRRHLEESLREAAVRAQRNGTPLALLVLDVDRFKQINDTHGHAAGDEVLKAFARRLRECVYDVDLPARLGGDEFVVLVEYAPSIEVGETVARRIIQAMAEPIRLAETELVVGTSIGVGVHFPVRTAERVVELADQALYDAKAAGRGTWRTRTG